MAREFIATKTFDTEWDNLGLNDETLRQLQNHILQNPKAGDIIQGTGGLTKLRWKLPSTGKSSGIRVLYIDLIRQEVNILINCYAKSDKDNITAKEKAMYKKFIDEMRKELGL